MNGLRGTWKSTGGIDNIYDSCIPFSWASSMALVLFMLTHWQGLLGHLMEWSHCDKSKCLPYRKKKKKVYPARSYMARAIKHSAPVKPPRSIFWVWNTSLLYAWNALKGFQFPRWQKTEAVVSEKKRGHPDGLGVKVQTMNHSVQICQHLLHVVPHLPVPSFPVITLLFVCLIKMYNVLKNTLKTTPAAQSNSPVSVHWAPNKHSSFCQ